MRVYSMRTRMRMKMGMDSSVYARANSYIQNRWFTYYKFVGINLEMFSGMCSMIANIYAIKQCYCDNKFVLWIEIVRRSSSSNNSNSAHSFIQSIIYGYYGRFYLFILLKQKTQLIKVQTAVQFVYRPLFCQISGMYGN